jgi:subtilisin-like proprotein convertase family protein
VALSFLFPVAANHLNAAGPEFLLAPQTRDQIDSLQTEKLSRTPAQRKLDSQLVYAVKEKRQGFVSGNAISLRSSVATERDGRVLVDISAVVAPSLLSFIEQNGGTVIASFERYHAIRALLPISALEIVAADPQVRSIRPAERAVTNTSPVAQEGDVAHRADQARIAFPTNGRGIKIGVLSDSVDYLSDAQAAGALGNVTVLPGQGGSGTGEGTAMLEVVHSLAPGADLYFATAFSGAASFANNIRGLYAAGCRIIVDDVTYFAESPFQDGTIAQAVDEVCAKGALFFSSAGNSGNIDHGSGGTWEGDFKDGGPATQGRGGRLHDFGGGITYNTVTSAGLSFRRVDMFWADPLGASTNDYDVYILDSNGSVVRSSTNIQDGQGDPYESIQTLNIGERIVIVKYSGDDRYLWLSSGRGALAIATPGSTRGHNAARVANCLGIAATAVGKPPQPFSGGSTNPVENFSSDGPRRIFFNPDGSAITPGNYSSTGGFVVSKPDLTAADGVSTTVTNLNPFFGTSAAAPHAAAIAALVWSYSPLLTATAVNHILTSSTLDIEGPGIDRNSGEGIVMAYPAVAKTPQLILQAVQFQDANTNGYVDANECASVVLTLQNPGTNQPLANISGVLTASTPAVLADPVPTSFTDLAPGASASATFHISTTPQFTCGTNAQFNLQVTGSGNLSFSVPFQLNSIIPLSPPTNFASTAGSVPIPDLGSVESLIPVSGITAPVGHVQVAVHITHTYDYDLRLTLISPAGTNIVLSSNNGPGGQNYGISCDDKTNMTVFADTAALSIDSATPPFVGTFRPEQPLGALFGQMGSAVNGTWKLRVEDQVKGDTGTLDCWSLQIEPVAPCDGGGQCLIEPTIAQNPTDKSAFAGDTVAFTAAAQGSDPLTYQWYFNSTNPVPGGTNATLTLTQVTPTQVGDYLFVANNPYGSATSAPAHLAVSVVPLTLTVSSDQFATNGNSVSLSVNAQGSPPLSYQWYFNVTNPVPQGTNALLVFTNVTVDQSGAYNVVVSNPYSTLTSAPVQLTVVMPALIVSGPTNQVATNGDTVTLVVEAQGTAPLTYQWFFNATNLLNNATNSTLVLSNVAPAQAGLYGVVVQNAYGSGSNAATLAVVILPTITCGSNKTVELGTGWEFDVPAVTGSNTTLTVVSTTTNLNCGQTYTATRTWLVTDGAGYQASCSQTVQVVDTTAPVMTCPADKSVVLGAAWSFDVPSAQDSDLAPVLVYDNWSNNLASPFAPDTVEVGNQVTLAGTERYISRFAFGYWGSNSVQNGFQGSVQARVRFYANDGPAVGGAASPGTMLYDSGATGLVATNNGSVVIEDFQLGATVVPLVGALPNTFTWTVQFGGLSANDAAGLNLFSPPVVGSVLSQFWENGASGWKLRKGFGPVDFGGQIAAVSRGVTLSVLSTVTNATCGSGFSAAQAWQAIDACGNTTTCTQTVAVVDQGLPGITNQPQDQLVAEGETVTFTAGVSACPPVAYQWFFNQTNSIPGGTGASLILPSVTTNDDGGYTLVVSNQFGSVTSVVAQLAVSLSAPIVSAPTNTTATNGDTVSFSVIAHGAQPLSYQWYFNGTNSLPSGSTATLTLPNVTANNAGMYEVVVTNAYGSVTSPPAILTVAVPTTILSGPTDQLATNGAAASFTVAAAGSPPLTYQWYFNSSTALAGGTSATLSLNSVTPHQAGNYEVVVSNPYSTVTSSPALLTVVTPAMIVTNPANQVVTNGDVVSFSVVAQGTEPLGYQWFFNTTNLLGNETNTTLTLSNAAPVMAGDYTVVVTNAYNTVTSAPATFLVVTPASIVSGPTDQFATNGDTVSFSVSAAGDSPISYQWFFNGTISDGGTNAMLVLTNVTLAQAGTYEVAVSNPYGSVTSAPAQLNVVVPAFIVTNPTNQVATNGDTVVFAVEAHGTPPLSYQWYFQTNNLLDGATNITLVLSNVTPANIGAYSVVVSNAYNSLTSSPALLTVVVPPSIVSGPANQAVTNGGSASFGVTAAGDQPLAYQWFFERSNSVAQGTSATLVLNNVTTAQAGSYDVVVSNPYGSITSAPAVLKVIVPAVIVSDPTNQVVTNHQTVFVTAVARGSEPLSYQWYFNLTNILDIGTNATLVLSNIGPTQAGLYNVTVSNPYGSATSAPAQLSIVVPAEILTDPQDRVATNGSSVTFQVEAQGDAPLAYQWYFNGTNQLPGRTDSTLSLTGVSPANAGFYLVTVSNLYNTVTSTPARLSIVAPVLITSDPTNQVATNGNMVLFAVVAQGGEPISYQWYFDATNSVDGGTNATLVLTNVTAKNAGAYEVVVSNPFNSVTSAPAQLTVIVPAMIVSGPTNLVATNGGPASLSVLAEGDAPLSFQWYFNTTNVLAQGTNATLSLTHVSAANEGSYTVAVSNLYNSVTSAPALLAVVSPAVILSGPADVFATNGDTVSFSVSAQGGEPLAYQWYFNNTNALAAGTNATLSLTNIAVSQAGTYEVVVSNSYNSVTSAPASLTVVMPALIVSGPTNQMATNGDTVTLVVEAQGTAPLTYQWFFNATNLLNNATNSTLVLSNVAPAQAGLYGVLVQNAYGSASNAATLAVIVLPTITCGANKTVELGTGWEFDVPAVTGSNTTLTVVSTTTNLNCGQTYTATRTWLVTDGAGYQASCSQTVQVVDTTAPVMTCPADKSVVLGAAWSFDVPSAHDGGLTPVLVYDNWSNNLASPFAPGTVEVGNQVTLAGTERYISQFAFGYWASNSVQNGLEGSVQARVRFYANDGPAVGGAASPGTMLYDSGAIGLVATNNGSLVIQNFQMGATVVPLVGALPDTFTWTVQFGGLSANDTAGLNLFSPPVIGQVREDYWENDSTGWALKTNALSSTDFGGQLAAVSRGVTLSVLSTVTNATCGSGFTAAQGWQALDACGNSTTCTQTVTVVDQSAPSITSQPLDQAIPAGQTATFSVGISSCPTVTYQWYFNGTSPVSGGTAATLVLNNVTDNQAGDYEVVVSNPHGSVTSASAHLSVVQPLSITSNPTSQTVNYGDTASFTVTAQGGGTLTYQWYFNHNTLLTGATSPTLILNNVTLAQAGTYEVVVRNPFSSVTSTPVQLTVVLAAQIVNGPTDQTATNGDTVSFTVTAQGTPPLAYQWYFNGTNSLAQGTAATLQLTGVTTASEGTYQVVVSNPYATVTSAPARLTVVAPATILTGPSSLEVTNGDTASFSVIAAGAPPLNYQWYFNQNQALTGATGSTLTLTAVTPSQAGNYTVVVGNSFASVTSAPALLTVDVPASILVGPISQVVTSGTTVIFTATAQGTSPLAYQWWFNSTNQLVGATSASLTLAAVTNGNSGNYSVSVSNRFGSALSDSANLRVIVPSELISLTRNQNVVSLTFSTVPNLLYSVLFNDDLNTTNWTALPKATFLPGTGAPITVQDPRANGAYRFYSIVVQ